MTKSEIDGLKRGLLRLFNEIGGATVTVTRKKAQGSDDVESWVVQIDGGTSHAGPKLNDVITEAVTSRG